MNEDLIEAVLALIPEQVWAFDVDVPAGVDGCSTIEWGVEIPMRVRRAIVGSMLHAVDVAGV